MQRAIARQAEPSGAGVINAEGFSRHGSRAAPFSGASDRPAALSPDPHAGVATENNSTTIFPVPVDFLKAFMTAAERSPLGRPTIGWWVRRWGPMRVW
jgi:hypothetical protein